MPYTVPTYEQIRDQYLQAVVNQNTQADIGPDSDHFVRACAAAAVLEGVYAHQSWVFRQAFADLAEDDNMEKMANQRGLAYKAAIAATGVVRFSGTAGTAINAGQAVSTAQGVVFVTTAAAVIGVGGVVDVPAAGAIAGVAGNQSANTPATVDSPPLGVVSAALILSMTGGADTESALSLLERLLLEQSEIAQGGNDADYKRWALSVPGVARAYVFPVRRGTGTVDVVPLPLTGLPDAPLLASVQAVLDAKRPVGMMPGYGVLALLPTAIATPVAAAVSVADGFTLSGVSPGVNEAIATVFSNLGPGDKLVRNRLITAMLTEPGVTDVTLAAPSANVTSLVNPTQLQLVTLGTVALT
jgi:uncharacterized phage protein gp47/JayE